MAKIKKDVNNKANKIEKNTEKTKLSVSPETNNNVKTAASLYDRVKPDFSDGIQEISSEAIRKVINDNSEIIHDLIYTMSTIIAKSTHSVIQKQSQITKNFVIEFGDYCTANHDKILSLKKDITIYDLIRYFLYHVFIDISKQKFELQSFSSHEITTISDEVSTLVISDFLKSVAITKKAKQFPIISCYYEIFVAALLARNVLNSEKYVAGTDVNIFCDQISNNFATTATTFRNTVENINKERLDELHRTFEPYIKAYGFNPDYNTEVVNYIKQNQAKNIVEDKIIGVEFFALTSKKTVPRQPTNASKTLTVKEDFAQIFHNIFLQNIGMYFHALRINPLLILSYQEICKVNPVVFTNNFVKVTNTAYFYIICFNSLSTLIRGLKAFEKLGGSEKDKAAQTILKTFSYSIYGPQYMNVVNETNTQLKCSEFRAMRNGTGICYSGTSPYNVFVAPKSYFKSYCKHNWSSHKISYAAYNLFFLKSLLYEIDFTDYARIVAVNPLQRERYRSKMLAFYLAFISGGILLINRFLSKRNYREFSFKSNELFKAIFEHHFQLNDYRNLSNQNIEDAIKNANHIFSKALSEYIPKDTAKDLRSIFSGTFSTRSVQFFVEDKYFVFCQGAFMAQSYFTKFYPRLKELEKYSLYISPETIHIFDKLLNPQTRAIIKKLKTYEEITSYGIFLWLESAKEYIINTHPAFFQKNQFADEEEVRSVLFYSTNIRRKTFFTYVDKEMVHQEEQQESFCGINGFFHYLTQCLNYLSNYGARNVSSIVKIPTVENLGYEVRFDGSPLKTPLPNVHVDPNAISSQKLEILRKEVQKYNREQVEIHQYYIKSIPKIIDRGFREGDGAKSLQPLYQTIDTRNVFGQELQNYITNVRNFNSEQNMLFKEGLDNIPKISNLGFKKTAANLPLNNHLPRMENYKLVSKGDIINLSQIIYQYNTEQKQILKDVLDKIEIIDYGYRYDVEGKIFEIGYPNTDLAKIKNATDAMKYVNHVKRWNELQNKLAGQQQKITKIINRGFKGEIPVIDNKAMDHPGYRKEIDEKVRHYNLLQKQQLDAYIAEKVIQVEDLGFRNEISGEKIEITVPIKFQDAKVALQTKNDVDTYVDYIKKFNYDQFRLLDEHLRVIPRITDLGYRFHIIDSKQHIKYDVQNLSLGNLKKRVDLERRARQITEFNEEQEAIFQEHLATIPKIKNLLVTFAYNRQPVVHSVPEYPKLSNRHEIDTYIDKVILFNDEQASAMAEYTNHLPDIEDFGFDEEDGVKVKKPIIHKGQLLTYPGYLELSSHIIFWNKTQERIREEYFKTKFHREDLGFHNYPDGRPLHHDVPFVAIDKIVTKKYIISYTNELKNFNIEQKKILAESVKILPAINDLGYRSYPNGDSLIYNPPAIDEAKIKNFNDFKEKRDEIKAFNNEQTDAANLWISKIPTIVDYGFDYADKVKMIMPTIPDFAENQSHDVVLRIHRDVEVWNQLQKDLLDESVDGLPRVISRGFTTHLNGIPLDNEKPNVDQDFSKFEKTKISRDFVFKYRIMILNYNKEQYSILQEYLKKNCPNIIDAGFKINDIGEEAKPLEYEKPSLSWNKIKNRKSADEYIEKIKQYNIEQSTLLKDLIAKKIKLIDFGFGKEDGVPFPKPDISKIRSKNEVESVALICERWNKIQQAQLRNALDDLVIHDCGYEKKLDGSPLSFSHPSFDIASENLNRNDIILLREKVFSYNDEQQRLLKFHRRQIPVVIDYGYYPDNILKADRPPIVDISTFSTKAQIDEYIAKINRWNNYQKSIIKKKNR